MFCFKAVIRENLTKLCVPHDSKKNKKVNYLGTYLRTTILGNAN